MTKDGEHQKKKKKKKSKKRRRSEETDTGILSSPTYSSKDAAAACSWGSVFAAAAQLKPAEGIEDEEFLKQTESTTVSPGLAKISLLAAAAANKTHVAVPQKDDSLAGASDGGKPKDNKKRKRNDSGGSDNDDMSSTEHDTDKEAYSSAMTLEGLMVPHPHVASEQVMVLIDSKQSIVYSGMERTPSGDYLRIGSIENGDISWDDHAYASTSSSVTTVDNEGAPSDGAASFPFPTDADDHCESPLEAYRDVLPFLEMLSQGKDEKKDLAIYDPYYCNGAVKRNLKELGFPTVYNEKVDCYAVWNSGVGYPSFDVLMTNPPYSEDHIPKLLQHVTSQNFESRPWFLLLPTWVHKKDYYKNLTKHIKPFFLVPTKRYTYLPPKQFREKKASDVHKKSSPFVSMWYIWGGSLEKNEALIQHYQQVTVGGESSCCDLVRSKSALRDLRRKGKRNK